MKKIKIVILILFGLMLLVPISAFAQLSPEFLIEQLKAEGKGNCEIVNFDSIDIPIRISMTHEATTDQEVSVSFEDRQSQFSKEESEEYLAIYTNSTGQMTMFVNYNYESRNTERNYFYTIESNNIIIERGNWIDASKNFCKMFVTNNKVPIRVPTFDEMVAIVNSENSKLVMSLSEKTQENTEVILLFVLIGGVVVFAIIIMLILFILARVRDKKEFDKISQKYRKAHADFVQTNKDVQIQNKDLIDGLKKSLNDYADSFEKSLEKSIKNINHELEKSIFNMGFAIQNIINSNTKKTEEPKTEPVKEEPKTEPVKEEPKTEPVKEEPKTEPVKEEPKEKFPQFDINEIKENSRKFKQSLLEKLNVKKNSKYDEYYKKFTKQELLEFYKSMYGSNDEENKKKLEAIYKILRERESQ